MPPESTIPRILLIHGVAGSSRSFDALLPHLTGMEVRAIDLPGHGALRSEPTVRSLDVHMAFVADRLIDDAPSVLVGHSLGCLVVLGAALRRPAAVRGLVLLGGGAHIVVTPFLQRLASERFHELVVFLRKAGFSPATDPSLTARESAQAVDVEPSQAAADFAALDGVDLTEQLSALRCPSLVIAGADDRMVPPSTSQALAQRLTGPGGERPAPFVLLEQTGHMLHQERPQQVAERLRSFVAQLA